MLSCLHSGSSPGTRLKGHHLKPTHLLSQMRLTPVISDVHSRGGKQSVARGLGLQRALECFSSPRQLILLPLSPSNSWYHFLSPLRTL
ncbi:hypothetical protein ACRRTK_015261 [Alexandromys fortis]